MLNALRKILPLYRPLLYLHLYRPLLYLNLNRPLRLILDFYSLSSKKKKSKRNNKKANKADKARKGPKGSQRRIAYKACKLYSVNTGSIRAHLRGITKSERIGRPPRFTVQQEQVLLDLIFQLASCLTNEAAMNLLGAEAAAKRQKLVDSEI